MASQPINLHSSGLPVVPTTSVETVIPDNFMGLFPGPEEAAPSEIQEPASTIPIQESVMQAVVTAPIVQAVTPTTQLEGALAQARRGIPQTPILKGTKKPLLTDWPSLATTSEAQIEAWAKEYPECNFGSVAKGQIGGFWMLELDAKDEAKRIRIETNKQLPDTLLVRSRIGRGHLYWKHSLASIAMGNIGQDVVKGAGFSVRVNNEQCVSPGSIHPITGEPYTILQDAPIVEAPQWLIDWIEEQRQVVKKDPSKSLDSILANKTSVPEGERNTTLYRIGCKFRGAGMSDEGILEELHHWNEELCDGGLKEDEIQSIAGQVIKRPQGDPRPDVIFNNTPNPLAGVAQVVEEQPKEWGTPEEIDDALLPVKSFDLDFVPNCMQALVLDTAQRMSVPTDFTGVSALAVLAGCMNRRAFVYPKKQDKKWKEAISISGALVASSGELKTPTFRAFTNILTELEIDWRKIHTEVMQKYEQEAKAIKEQNKQIKRDEGVPLDMPKEPAPSPRIIVNDATPERLHQLMAKNPAGMFVFRDEMSGWVSELDKEGREGQRPLFLAAMNGNDPHSVDRIGREDEFAIMSASIFGGFQPDLLMEFLSDSRNVSDGTFARLGLLVWPDPTNIPTVDRLADEPAYLTARKIMRVLAEMSVQQVQLHFGEDAQLLFDEWFEKLRLKLKAETHLGKKSHLSKYRGLLPKLAGLLQLADLVGCLPSNILNGRSEKDAAAALQGVQYIDSDHLKRAIHLLDYLESHMNRVYACSRGPNQQAVRALASLIRRGEIQGSFTIRDIVRNGYADLDNPNRVDFATDTLMLRGWLREAILDRSKGGRPTTRWEIHPQFVKAAK